MAISPIVPTGFANVPIPVNPLRIRRPRPVDATSEPLDITPVGRTSRIRAPADRKTPRTYSELESLYLLSVETRRALLELDENHPLNGPHPTD